MSRICTLDRCLSTVKADFHQSWLYVYSGPATEIMHTNVRAVASFVLVCLIMTAETQHYPSGKLTKGAVRTLLRLQSLWVYNCPNKCKQNCP